MKFKTKKRYYRAFSLLLATIMFSLSVPISVAAENDDYIEEPQAITEDIISESSEEILFTSTQTQKSAEIIASDRAAMRAEQLIQCGIDPDEEVQNNAEAGLIQNGSEVQAVNVYQRTIDDGVYAISNVGNSNSAYTMYMDTNLAHWLPGYNMQQYKFSTAGSGNPAPFTPLENFETSALFKITQVPETGSYIIRIMRNNALSFGIYPKEDSSGLEVLTKYIPLDDALVPYEDTYVIQASGTELKLRKYGSSNCIAAYAGQASGNAGQPNSFLYATNQVSDQIRWKFTRYTGAERNDITMLGSGSLEAGKTTTLTPVFYSTRPGYNVVSLNMSKVTQASYTMTGPDLYGNFTVTPHKGPNWAVGIFIKNSSNDTAARVFLGTHNWNIILPFEEGAYFFNNVKYSNKYVQINNIDNMKLPDTIIELHNFHGYYEQRWNVVHVEDLYYKIISQHSDLALTAPTGANNDVVTQTTYTEAVTQLWKFIEQSDGTYKISPESNSNYFMAAGDSSYAADQDLEIRTEQSDHGHKWKVRRYNGNVQLEAQQQSNWCWAACARMFTMNFFDPLMSQASAAVYVKLNTVTHNPTTTQIQQANFGANISELKEAVQYLLDEDFTFGQFGKIYTEEILRNLLDQSTPVIILRGWYTGEERNSGHFCIIYDYIWDAEKGIYIYNIYDPAPVNLGSTYYKSYDNICNGRNAGFEGEVTDTGIWEGAIVYKMGLYDYAINASIP